MYESPKIDVYFIKSKADFVGGIGEPAVPVIQPALGNAILMHAVKDVKFFLIHLKILLEVSYTKILIF